VFAFSEVVQARGVCAQARGLLRRTRPVCHPTVGGRHLFERARYGFRECCGFAFREGHGLVRAPQVTVIHPTRLPDDRNANRSSAVGSGVAGARQVTR